MFSVLAKHTYVLFTFPITASHIYVLGTPHLYPLARHECFIALCRNFLVIKIDTLMSLLDM